MFIYLAGLNTVMPSDSTPDEGLSREELLRRLHASYGDAGWFRDIVEHAHDAIYIIHPREGFQYVNPAFERLTGYTVADVRADDFSFWDIIHPDDVDMIRRRGASRERGEEVPGRYEFRILASDGDVRTVEATTMPLDTGDGLVAGILRDITDRVEMEHALQESKNLFRELTESTTAAVFIYQDDVFKYVNPAMERITGIPEDRLLGMPFLDVVHPDERDMVLERARMRLQGSSEQPGRYEVRIVTRDGATRWIDLAVTVITYEGRPAGLGNAIDITERKQTERALRESEETFRHLAERSLDGIFAYDRRGRFTYASPAVRRIAGYEPEEIEGTFFGRYILMRDLPKTLSTFARLMMGKPVEAVQFRVKRKDGEVRTVEVNAVPVMEEGRITGAQGNIRDITETTETRQRLRESEERYAMLFEQSNDAIMILDLTGKIVDVNDRYETIFSRREEDIVGRRFSDLDIDYSLSTKDIFQKIETLITRRELDDFEITVQDRVTDETFTVNVKANLIKLPEGRFIQTVIRDVTDRKRAERELRYQRKYFEALFNDSPEAIASLDVHNHVITVNRAFEELFGYTAGELQGKNIDDVIVPEHLQKEGRNISERVERGEIVRRESVRRSKTGEMIPVSILGAPVVIDDRQEGIFGIYRDISARVTAEQALRESEEQYREMVENINDVLYTTDMEGMITYISPVIEQLSGFVPEEIIGNVFTDFIHEDDVPRVRQRFKQIISGGRDGRPSPDEYRIVLKSGDVRWVRTSSRPVFEDGMVVGLRGVMTDVTDRRQAEQKIAELNDTLRLLNKIMRHDILNDLQIARSSLELYDEEAEPALYEKAIRRMRHAVELINRMRGLESLVASGEELRPVDLREVAEDIAADCTVECRVAGKAVVMADDALYSVLQNLVHNAMVHGRADMVDISMRCNDATCEILVADNGVGIPDSLKDRVFGEGYSHGDAGGTGLGLYIVKQTVERYGGSVAVEDNEPRGTVFVLRLRRGER